jgi:hypothetical protein
MCGMKSIANFLGSSYFRRSHLPFTTLYFVIDVKLAWLVGIWATVVYL